MSKNRELIMSLVVIGLVLYGSYEFLKIVFIFTGSL